MNRKELLLVAEQWFKDQGWSPFPFQKQTWQAFLRGVVFLGSLRIQKWTIADPLNVSSRP